MREGDRVYVSGQGPVNPETVKVESDDIREQTARALENVAAILEAAGTSLDEVLKTNVYVTDMDDYDAVNDVYAEYMSEPYPARAAVEVSRLPTEISVEIEVVARVKQIATHGIRVVVNWSLVPASETPEPVSAVSISARPKQFGNRYV